MPRSTSMFMLLLVQLLAAAAALHIYHLESPEFARASALFLAGAALSWALPDRFRLHVMNLASLAGAFILFSPAVALLILAVSSAILWIGRAPWSTAIRYAALVGLGALLLLWRWGTASGGRAWTVVPVIGAIFMLRVASYLREARTGARPPPWREGWAFFLLVPNMVYWFFPLIDFGTFREAASRPREMRVYQKGMDWIFEGVLQLILYRVLHAAFFLPLEQVNSYGDFFRFLILTYLAYIRVSGAFHLMTGTICLYGVELPRTHRDYLFADSFIDLSRRLNIYWKDFMARNIYRPVRQILREKRGISNPTLPVLAVFGASLLLHGYVYLWTKGYFLLRVEDGLFWGLAGLGVVVDLLLARRRLFEGAGPVLRVVLHWGKITYCLFAFSVIWAIWNCPSVGDLAATFWLLRWRGPADFAWVALFPAIAGLGTLKWLWRRSGEVSWSGAWRWRDLSNAGLIALGCVAAWPGIAHWMNADHARVLADVLDPDFTPEFEFTNREHNYYEAFKTVGERPAADEDELPIGEHSIYEPLPDYRRRRLRPNLNAIFRGHRFITNRWGMNDERDYALEKPPGVVRVALISASNSMSYSIRPGRQWPRQAEQLLAARGFRRVELLNFSVIGYSGLQAPWIYQQEVARFHPDVVIYAGAARELWLDGFNASTALRSGLEIPYPDELLPVLGLRKPHGFLARHYPVQPSLETDYGIFEWGLRKVADLARADGAGLIYVLTPTLFEGSAADLQGTRWDELNMLKTAKDAGFFTVDLGQTLNGHTLEDVTLADDRFNYNHLNERGHALLAEEFARVLAGAPEALTVRRPASVSASAE